MCIDAFDLFSTKINRQMYEYIKDFDELELETKCVHIERYICICVEQ